MKRIASVVGVLAALVAVGVFVAGCGQEQQHATGSTEGGSAVVAQPASMETPAETPASAGAPVKDLGSVPADGVLPPEVEVISPDGTVERGQVVGLFALGSEDVKEIVLGDDRGEQQPFAYDESTKRWHTLYRVPLKSKRDPIGLSVTARNEAGRWRRVWVFLSPQEPGTAQSTGSIEAAGETTDAPADSLTPQH